MSSRKVSVGRRAHARMAGRGPAAAAVLSLTALALALAGRAEAAAPATAAPGTISTVAGGTGGPAAGTRVNITVDDVSFGNGTVYVTNVVVRQLSPQTGRLSTFAGNGFGLPTANGAVATKTGLGANGSTVDSAGNVVVADEAANRIEVVAGSTGTFYGQAVTKGRIYRVAGCCRRGYSGDGGPATSAELNNPYDTAVTPAGNLAISDLQNNRIRMVAESTGTFYGVPMTKGDIYTIAGNGTRGFSGDGGPAASARVNNPFGITSDSAGNVLFDDGANWRIRVIAATTGTFYGQAMTAGDIYTIAGDGTPGFFGDGGPATDAELGARGVALDGTGNVLIADTNNSRIRVVAETTGTFYGQAMTKGDIYTVAGNGSFGFSGDSGPATSATLNGPTGMTTDGSGNLVIADESNNRVRVAAASTGTFYGRPMTAGDIYTVAGHSGTGLRCCPGLPATVGQLPGLDTVTTDAAGNTIIGLWTEIEVIAGSTGTFYHQAMKAGDLYVIAGNGRFGFSGDGGQATEAEMNQPNGLATDAAGNVIFSDSQDQRIRVVANQSGTFYGLTMTAGDIYTIAGNGTIGSSGNGGPATSAEFAFPEGVTLDAAGNLLVADSQSNQIRVIAASTGSFYGQAMTAGHIYSIAGTGANGPLGDGGPATSADLELPQDASLDAAGNLVIADSDNFRIRVVAESAGTFYGQAMTAGDIYTVAGTGQQGYSGDGGPATGARLGDPSSVAADGAGNLVLTDSLDPRIRVVAESSGTFYGVAMTTGDIYTIAGNGTGGGAGDGGPGPKAELAGPTDVTVTSAGNLLVADQDNAGEEYSRVRMIQG